ncbi:phage holin family protein [Synechococcus sp. M16CYN]|uniref:phage holin family protein n=1 Tax=Synechococcus sp. M16CYN TaxID=3103139 RepID=UPI00333F5F90
MGPIGWLLQWPIRALVLLLVAAMPLGVELSSFSTALGSAALIGLLGTVLMIPLKLVLALPWALVSLGGLITPINWLFNWLIAVILFSLTAFLIDGFRLKNGLSSAVLGAMAYGVLSTLFIHLLDLG